MKCVSRFFIFIQILILVFIAGCAKPSLPEIGAFMETYGVPHIVQDGVCYYVSYWGPGANVLKIYYKGSPEKGNSKLQRSVFGVGDTYYQVVTSIEWEFIDVDDLHFYIPLLIESLKETTQGGVGGRALVRLYDIMYMEFPNGYGDYYMHPTKDTYTGTPFERDSKNRYPELDETTYNKWKQWWETEGHTAFP